MVLFSIHKHGQPSRVNFTDGLKFQGR